MQFIDAVSVRKCLPWKITIEALRTMFREGCEAPVRAHYNLEKDNQVDATMLVMPAWNHSYSGIKVVNVFPDNAQKGLETIMGGYLLMSGENGQPLAFLDASELTARRTCAASALASNYLSRQGASKLLIVGAGRLGSYLGEAHQTVRPITEVKVWARRLEAAQALADEYCQRGFKASAIESLEQGVQWADIVSCATLSDQPLIKGEWVQAGTHVDLMGAFKPNMRESDNALVQKASVFIDTYGGALKEAGDLLIPIQQGDFEESGVKADLAELTQTKHQGRVSDNEITLFKSVGASLEDLAAAIACYERYGE